MQAGGGGQAGVAIRAQSGSGGDRPDRSRPSTGWRLQRAGGSRLPHRSVDRLPSKGWRRPARWSTSASSDEPGSGRPAPWPRSGRSAFPCHREWRHPSLFPMTSEETHRADLWATGVSNTHPIQFIREELESLGLHDGHGGPGAEKERGRRQRWAEWSPIGSGRARRRESSSSISRMRPGS